MLRATIGLGLRAETKLPAFTFYLVKWGWLPSPRGLLLQEPSGLPYHGRAEMRYQHLKTDALYKIHPPEELKVLVTRQLNHLVFL